MATLTLELEDDVLERAQAAAARLPGRTLEDVLTARVNEMGGSAPSEQRKAFERLIELADARKEYAGSGMPTTSEERNSR